MARTAGYFGPRGKANSYTITSVLSFKSQGDAVVYNQQIAKTSYGLGMLGTYLGASLGDGIGGAVGFFVGTQAPYLLDTRYKGDVVVFQTTLSPSDTDSGFQVSTISTALSPARGDSIPEVVKQFIEHYAKSSCGVNPPCYSDLDTGTLGEWINSQ